MPQSLATAITTTAVERRDAVGHPAQVVGDWTIVRPLGQGRLGKVYQVRPLGSRDEQSACYALKLLHRQWHDDPSAVAMFRREVQVGREVSHRHLVPILDARVSHAPYYFVMPLLAGTTLRARLDAHWQPPVPVALWIARQTTEALAALESADWWHGDIKPANLMDGPDGHVTLLDLGFARRRGEPSHLVQRPVLGTLAYMAPEALTSSLAADIRSDIYSLGVVLYEMLSRRLPFVGRELGELARAHREQMPEHLSNVVPHVPEAVAELVRAMLAKQPLRRPQTANELVDRLAALEVHTFRQRVFGEAS